MTFSRAASGYEGSFSSPQLRVVGIPLTRVRYEAPSLNWDIAGDETTSTFEGALRGDTLSGRSTGDWRTAGFLELVRDAAAAVEALRSRPHVAPAGVGIHGHSQGGTIAPWVASENRHVAFVIAPAAGGVSMAEMETYSLENSLNVRGMPPAEKRLVERFVRAIVSTAYEGKPRSDLDRAWAEARGHSWAFEPPPASDSYWSFSRRIADYDPPAFWRQVAVPALLAYGGEDERVPPRRSAARIAWSNGSCRSSTSRNEPGILAGVAVG